LYPIADILLIYPTIILLYITSLFGKGYIWIVSGQYWG